MNSSAYETQLNDEFSYVFFPKSNESIGLNELCDNFNELQDKYVLKTEHEKKDNKYNNEIIPLEETGYGDFLSSNVILFPGTTETEAFSFNTNDNVAYYYNEYINLKKEVDNMVIKLDKALPIHTILFMILNTIMLSILTTMLFFFYKFNIYIVKPFYLITFSLMNITLLATAASSLKDWRNFLNERK